MVTLGCQTNVWKREMAAGKLFWDVLGEVKEAGCTGIESGWWQIGDVCDDLPRLKAELDCHGLELVSIFSAVSKWVAAERGDERAAFTRNCEILQQMGASLAVLGTGPAERSPDSYRQVSEVLNTCGAIARDHGLKLSLHPHGIAGGPEDWRALTDLCPPELVGYCADLGNLDMYGSDPLDFCSRYFDRINYIHFKDYSGEDSAFVPLGQGQSQIAACTRALVARGFSGWMMIEHETPYAQKAGACAAITQDMDFVRSVLRR